MANTQDYHKNLNDNLANERLLASYEDAIKLNPKDPLAYLNKGKMLLELGKYDEGFRVFQYAMKMTSS